MSEEISPDIVALYRANAIEEPDASLDAAILRAARPRRIPHTAFAALTILLAAAANLRHRRRRPQRRKRCCRV